MTEHERLLQIMPKRPEDYEPWGKRRARETRLL